MKLISIFRILYQKKWIILSCTVLAIAAAYVLTRNEPKIFKSNAQLSTGYTVTSELRLSDEIFNLSQIDVKFNNAIADMTSAKMMSLLSYSLILNDLTSSKPFRQPEASSLDKKPELKNIDKAEAIRIFRSKTDSIQVLSSSIATEKKLLDLLDIYNYSISSLKQFLYVGRHLRTDYINVAFRSENPELSAYTVNTFCKEFQRYNEAIRKERSLESVIALDSLVKKKKQELDEKISAKTRFLTDSVSSSLDPNMVGVNILSQIGQIESGLADEEARVQDLSYQLTQLNQQLLNTGSGNPVTTTTSQGNNSQWLLLRRQYYDLRQEYQSKGSSDPEMKKRLDDLEARMNAAAPSSTPASDGNGGTSVNISGLTERKINAEGQLRSSRFKINGYRNKLGELNARLRNASPAASASLDKYDKDIEASQLEYTNTKEKLTMASDMSDAFIHNFRQTLFGQASLEPEPSKKIVIMGLSGLCAFILTSLVFIFLSYIDQSIKTPSQFQRQTNLKLLGTVNFINLKQNTLAEQVTHVELEDGKRDNYFRELLRKLRYEIEKSGKRIILFTSTEPRQGKTTLSQALAFSLHLGKKRVLLLDTNFCNNDLTQFNNANPTLEQFSGNGQLTPAQYGQMITKTVVEYVDIIGCKGGDYTPSEILPKNHLLNYLPDLLKEYDYIFMEAAPLNGFTDAKELVQFADGVIAIFSATAEVRQADRESIKFLQELNNKFVGAILNKVGKSDINL